MSLEEKVSKSFVLRPAQKEMLDAIAGRLNRYQQSVEAKINELRSAVEEAVFFVKKDLGVPLDQPHVIKANEDGTLSFVPAPVPTAQVPPTEVPGPAPEAPQEK